MTTTARTSSSASMRSNTPISSRAIVAVNALSLSGRFSVIVATLSATAYAMCSKDAGSVMCAQPMSAAAPCAVSLGRRTVRVATPCRLRDVATSRSARPFTPASAERGRGEPQLRGDRAARRRHRTARCRAAMPLRRADTHAALAEARALRARDPDPQDVCRGCATPAIRTWLSRSSWRRGRSRRCARGAGTGRAGGACRACGTRRAGRARRAVRAGGPGGTGRAGGTRRTGRTGRTLVRVRRRDRVGRADRRSRRAGSPGRRAAAARCPTSRKRTASVSDGQVPAAGGLVVVAVVVLPGRRRRSAARACRRRRPRRCRCPGPRRSRRRASPCATSRG